MTHVSELKNTLDYDDLGKIETKIDTLMENIMHKNDTPQLLQKSAHQISSVESSFINFIRSGESTLYNKSLSRTDQNGLTLPQISISTPNTSKNYKSSMRQLAQVTTIENERLDILVDPEGDNAGWASETQERNETDISKLRTITIHTHHLYAKPRISQQLLDDSLIDLEQIVVDKIDRQFSRLENQAFINGSGENMPKGFLTYPRQEVGEFNENQTLQVIKIGHGDSLTAHTLIDTVNSMKVELLEGSSWIMSRSALSLIKKLKDNDGRFVWQASLAEGTPHTLLGFPVFLSDDMPQVQSNKTSTPIAFGNFNAGYCIVDRQDMKILRDPFSAKPYVEFYTTKRVGGDVINFDAIKIISIEEQEV